MREYPQMRIRLSPELKEKIQRHADENGRSMNSEIVARLEASFGRTGNFSVTKAINYQKGGELAIVNSLIEALKSQEPLSPEQEKQLILFEEQRKILAHEISSEYWREAK